MSTIAETKDIQNKPLNNKYNLPVKSTENRKEYDKLIYQLKKEEKIKQSREYYSQHKEKHNEQSQKYIKKYREGFKILKEMYKDNDIPEKYKEKVIPLFTK